jgi:hypothetical protein
MRTKPSRGRTRWPAAYAKLASEVPIAEDDDREHLAQDLATL